MKNKDDENREHIKELFVLSLDQKQIQFFDWQYDIASAIVQGGTRCVYQIPPGFGKSTIMIMIALY